MELNFMSVHMSAVLPKQTSRGIDLVATIIVDNGDSKKHLFGLRVEIPEGYIGLLLPVPSIVDKIEKVGYLGIITPEDKNKEISVVYTAPDDLIHDFYKVGEITATLIVIPNLQCKIQIGSW